MKATIVLTEPVCKRVIARGVAAEPAVRQALAEGTIVITLGTTNAFVAEELLGRSIDREAFAAGFIDDRFNLNARLGDLADIVLRRGVEWDGAREELLEDLTVGDVVIKGGNALDPWGTVGVLLGARNGGTVARYHALALARGVEMVIPISMAKSVHSTIAEVALRLGADGIARSSGIPCGMYPLTGRVVTEADALETLYPIRAYHIASGGVGKGAGNVSLLLEGPGDAVDAAYELVQSFADEQDVQLKGAR